MQGDTAALGTCSASAMWNPSSANRLNTSRPGVGFASPSLQAPADSKWEGVACVSTSAVSHKHSEMVADVRFL